MASKELHSADLKAVCSSELQSSSFIQVSRYLYELFCAILIAFNELFCTTPVVFNG